MPGKCRRKKWITYARFSKLLSCGISKMQSASSWNWLTPLIEPELYPALFADRLQFGSIQDLNEEENIMESTCCCNIADCQWKGSPLSDATWTRSCSLTAWWTRKFSCYMAMNTMPVNHEWISECQSDQRSRSRGCRTIVGMLFVL